MSRIWRGLDGEVISINSNGQLKPFVYLNWSAPVDNVPVATGQKKIPPFGGISRQPSVGGDLLTGLSLSLVAWILLLLTRLLATALLLAGLLTWGLILLTGVLVLIRHLLNLPC
ncbi:MAG: hypothetical protein JSS22_19260 [Proteobacteria bacterium]|nr:hypothetical protein [Pseudomonadota bacterium]